MATLDVTIGDRLPGAEDPLAIAISFGEDATDTIVRILESLDGFSAQVTDEHGSFNVRMFGVTTNANHIYVLKAHRVRGDDFDVYDAEELIPFDTIRRIHVW